jgi:hypothetical protein
MKRPLVVLCAAAAALFAASAAEAGGVSWSVGVNVPPVATYVSGGPAWYPAPVRYAPPVVLRARTGLRRALCRRLRRAVRRLRRAGLHARVHYWAAPAARWHHGWDRHDRGHATAAIAADSARCACAAGIGTAQLVTHRC